MIDSMIQRLFERFLSGKKVAILGFGKEGQSTYKVIRELLPEFPLLICDSNDQLNQTAAFLKDNPETTCYFGENYLDGLKSTDLVIKTPGISFKTLEGHAVGGHITSQTELFLQLFRRQVCGITGTKGKSTTATLLYHIMQQSGFKAVLAGNIGVPPFDLVPQIDTDTRIIFEMSSHQLEHLKTSPHIAILLNIFQEHLDHYHSYEKYQQAKLNIARWQKPEDYFIFNPANEVVLQNVSNMQLAARQIRTGCYPKDEYHICRMDDNLHALLPTGEYMLEGVARRRHLPGDHNLANIAAACTAALLMGATPENIAEGVATFNGLAHRLEYVGSIGGADYYNDSIATIPEAAMEAVNAFPATQTLILGGFDRGVDYSGLIYFLETSPVSNLVFMGAAGQRMIDLANEMNALRNKNVFMTSGLHEAFEVAVQYTGQGGVCIMSPAAASYDAFRNFEERGKLFRQLVQQRGKE
jgi:UDP-N-acetylmuramoyl-L-alanine---L-glutamate ligase